MKDHNEEAGVKQDEGCGLRDRAQGIDFGVIRPVVAAVLSMENFREAYEQKPVRGKFVLRIAEL